MRWREFIVGAAGLVCPLRARAAVQSGPALEPRTIRRQRPTSPRYERALGYSDGQKAATLRSNIVLAAAIPVASNHMLRSW